MSKAIDERFLMQRLKSTSIAGVVAGTLAMALFAYHYYVDHVWRWDLLSVGITMADNSLLSAGPNSILSLDRFEFDPTSSQGQFDAQLRKGSLAVISGRIAKQSPEAMTVRTPSAILGVRGTEFVLSAND